MREFIIRTVQEHEWPAIQKDRLADVMMLAGFGCTQADGSGDFRMMCGPSEVSFSGEEVGWIVMIDDAMSDENAAELVEALIVSIGTACGEPCESIQIT